MLWVAPSVPSPPRAQPRASSPDRVGPVEVPATGTTTYTFTETAAGSTTLANYTTTWSCVDTANGGASLGSGAGRTFTLTPSALQVPVCTFVNAVIPPDPTISVKKDVVARVGAGDQFTIGATGAGLSGASATTSGTVPGIQAAVVGPTDAVPGETYTITESSAGTTDEALYASTYVCLDLSNGNTTLASGTGTTGSFVMPAGAIPSVVECTFRNEPLAPTVGLRKNVVERALVDDQFDLTITGGTLTGATATTSGTATGVQVERVTAMTAGRGDELFVHRGPRRNHRVLRLLHDLRVRGCRGE